MVSPECCTLTVTILNLCATGNQCPDEENYVGLFLPIVSVLSIICPMGHGFETCYIAEQSGSNQHVSSATELYESSQYFNHVM